MLSNSDPTAISTPIPALPPRSLTLIRREFIAEVSATASLLRHNQTGAQILHLHTTDEHRVFATSFQTPNGHPLLECNFSEMRPAANSPGTADLQVRSNRENCGPGGPRSQV